jgi:hypothetical protein
MMQFIILELLIMVERPECREVIHRCTVISYTAARDHQQRNYVYCAVCAEMLYAGQVRSECVGELMGFFLSPFICKLYRYI